MPILEAPCVELCSVPQTPSGVASPSPSPSDVSSASSPEPHNIRATPLFRALAMQPPDPEQPAGQDELERRLPGYRRIVIPRELTLIELLKQSSGVRTDDEVLQIREVKLRVVAERVGLRRINILAPRLRSLTLDGSAITSLRDLGIGLVHLKVLSINRCGLHSLDGVWGLGALRELSAAGNRFRDLQPLAALQKLHTLNLSDNPIAEASRLWTLGVCGALRRLSMQGTPAADLPHYRSHVATALPMLVYLDDRPMHNDVEYDSDGLFGVASSSESEAEPDPSNEERLPPAEPQPGPSSSHTQFDYKTPFEHPEAAGDGNDQEVSPARKRRSRRPATTENAGVRPSRPDVPRRPLTALDRPNVDRPTRLQILNTLMDEEWRCSGSKLTSQNAVCGNLTRALRRPTVYQRRNQGTIETEELLEETLEDAARALAAEIPQAPVIEDWIKFKEDTGIDIDIDFSVRQDTDPSKAIDRLEQIEKDTMERFKNGHKEPVGESSNFASTNFSNIMSDFEKWKSTIIPSEPTDLDSLFRDLNVVERNMDRFSDSNSETRSE